MKKVLIIQRVIPDYRVPFFLGLHAELAREGVDLLMLAGTPRPGEAFKDCRDELPFLQKTKNIHLFGPAYWMRNALSASRGADLVIFEQANGALHHYGLLLKRVFGGQTKCAFWGHGAHLNKARPHPLRDVWRNFWITHVDWWFAYTKLSADLVARSGFPKERITTVQNTIDTTALREARSRVNPERLNALRQELFGDQTAVPTGVFCGRLVAYKGVPFLLAAAGKIKEMILRFRMIIVGDGPERRLVEDFCKENPWCICVGAKHGASRVLYLALGDVWLNPGATGLSILDAFSAGIPYFTTHCNIHGPEIAYVQNDVNGGCSAPEVNAFSSMVALVLQSPEKLAQLKTSAYAEGQKYTIENMITQFAAGIISCLQSAHQKTG